MSTRRRWSSSYQLDEIKPQRLPTPTEPSDEKRDCVSLLPQTIAMKEGSYTIEGFEETWKKIHSRWNPNERVWVVDFELVNKCLHQ